jgi:hypothetical protein
MNAHSQKAIGMNAHPKRARVDMGHPISRSPESIDAIWDDESSDDIKRDKYWRDRGGRIKKTYYI